MRASANRAFPLRHHEAHITRPTLTPLDEIERLKRELREVKAERDEVLATLAEIRRSLSGSARKLGARNA